MKNLIAYFDFKLRQRLQLVEFAKKFNYTLKDVIQLGLLFRVEEIKGKSHLTGIAYKLN